MFEASTLAWFSGCKLTQWCIEKPSILFLTNSANEILLSKNLWVRVKADNLTLELLRQRLSVPEQCVGGLVVVTSCDSRYTWSLWTQYRVHKSHAVFPNFYCSQSKSKKMEEAKGCEPHSSATLSLCSNLWCWLKRYLSLSHSLKPKLGLL